MHINCNCVILKGNFSPGVTTSGSPRGPNSFRSIGSSPGQKPTFLRFAWLGSSKAEWRPVDGPSGGDVMTSAQVAFPVDRVGGRSGPRVLDDSHCNLYKVVMHQEHYFQYIQYKARIPDMKEFTLCTWHKLYNHSADHPLFSYALKDQPREIVSWLSNDARSSYYMMTVGGHTIYRLNYPLKKHKWYHTCQSWNGRTGEWQLWVNAERVGRGFYNFLVGKKIRGNGLAITGQDQRKYGGGFELNPKPGGLMGEVTLVHLYKAALTAGKAYNNHKHHHAHKFLHEGEEEQEEARQMMPQEMPQQELPEGATEYPFLRNMQLVPRLPINELNVVRQQQELQRMQQQELQQQLQQQLQQNNKDFLSAPFSSQSLRLFKRESSQNDTLDTAESKAAVHVMVAPPGANSANVDNAKQKRTAEFGVFPGVDLSGIYSTDGFQLGGGMIPLQDVRLNEPRQESSDEEHVPKKWNEPAEWEVRSIMSLCSGCGEDPFRKANVLSWRETSKKLYAGAQYVPAAQECHRF
ncbi:Pentaxin family [Nesidiocoris tenuis]|uniref:Pentaxin family n=1 Tax=Nesidiocoris tenuis TaxID=355587 RepID=A0ABN7BBK0_9HEMI|nr:Pentaxin family [Nesidiocoris tenuis]